MHSSDVTTTEVVAVLVGLHHGTPHVLTVDAGKQLPRGPLLADHRSLQVGLRSWVENQTGHTLGFVEQLYTFADRHRVHEGTRVISVAYLGLTRMSRREEGWRRWYELFPWEDQREGVTSAPWVRPLQEWIDSTTEATERDDRADRVRLAFGDGTAPFSPELCLDRYEVLYEAGLVAESGNPSPATWTGPGMGLDHRRILATGIARLRAKIQYRPVVFELLPDAFTLGQLQAAVEALSGCAVHKQNFRRVVEQHQLVEDTGRTTRETGGRPAKLVRFRREVLRERHLVGTKLPIPKSR